MIPTESKIKALPVAARYIRVSTEDQTEYSPDAQNKALLRYANENRYQTDDRYLFIDEGISGRKAEKRPAFMQMITQAKSKEHPFDIILVHKFDRFARSREDSVVYKSLLRKECGVRVISVTESIEDDKFSIILESMLEAMAEYYSINLSEEVKKGMSEKAIRGGLQCAPAFGYEVKDHMLVPVSEKADLIREIFRQFVGGRGYYAIARWLNENGVTTNFGNKFESRSVEYIIRNPVYIGKLRWNPSGRSRRDFENENIILADGAHEALILDDIWNAAQKRVHEIKSQWKYHGRPPEKKSDWISGLVHCAACGSPLVFSKPHYWKCNAYAKGACTCSQHIRDDLLKDAIIKRLQH
ncbi:MAG: recombinase family protein, partial [Clostridiales bacterium]|nr:recombinase family protein [Clostridiales bacterium]